VLPPVQWLGDRLESSFADLHETTGVGLEVAGPLRILAGGHEDGPVRLIDEPDRDLARTSAPTTGGRQQGDPAVATE
jgi:hypothetical protein